jgi:hypothetical protein
MLNNLLNSTKSPDSYLIGDINPNGVIDVYDLVAILDNQNRQADWLTKQEDKAE